MVHREMPRGFNPRFEIVSCFFEHDGKFLLLLRQDHKPQGNTWGVPAGKKEEGETTEKAMVRELEEETGFKAQPEIMRLADTVYVRYPDYDFTYHIFHYPSSEKHDVSLDSKSHKEFRWVTPEESLIMPLIPDLGHCVELFYRST